MNPQQALKMLQSGQPDAVTAAQIADFMTESGLALPPAYIAGMLKRNGGLIRIRRTLWYLMPIPPAVAKGRNYWMGSALKDWPAMRAYFKKLKNFPSEAIPIALCQNRDSPGPVLSLRHLDDRWEIWCWDFMQASLAIERNDAEGAFGTRLLDDCADLWQDDPTTMPLRQCQWQIATLPLPDSTYRAWRNANRRSKKPRQDEERTPWLEAGTLTLTTGKLALVDGMTYPGGVEETLVLPAGDYGIYLKMARFADDCRVAGLRLLSSDLPAEFVCEKEALDEEIGIDTASIAVCELPDRAQVDPEEWDEVMQDAAEYELYDAPDMEQHGLALFRFGGAVTLHTSTGFGDGLYPAFRLVADGEAAGVEVEFIRDDEEYPEQLRAMCIEEK